jgi:pyrroline-5-carboxylate reductase
MKSIGFVGAGRITRIMIEGWARAGRLPERIVVADPNDAAVSAVAAAFPSVAVGAASVAAGQDVVIISLHPPAMGEALPKLAPYLKADAIALSLAPKLRFAKLTELLGGFARLARQNPNAPSIVNQGYNPIAFAPGLDAAARGALLDLLKPLGATPEVDERTIEAYAVISAMGPTYLWFQMALLRRLAAEFGLDDGAAREAVAAMAHGAAATLLESDLAPERVMDLVPVKPLSADEETIAELYRSRLKPLYAKLAA